MNQRMRGIWDRIKEKEALAEAGGVLCARTTATYPPLKVWISAACGLAVAIAPVVGAAALLQF